MSTVLLKSKLPPSRETRPMLCDSYCRVLHDSCSAGRDSLVHDDLKTVSAFVSWPKFGAISRINGKALP